MRVFSSFSSPWPDPNSPVLSKIDFAAPLSELLKWLDVRDTFLGHNGKEQDIPKALACAVSCKHPDAVWLSSIFERKDVSLEEARGVLLEHENDARALCFLWWMDEWNDLSILFRAAENGCAFACSTLCSQVRLENAERAFLLAQQAALQQDRGGLRWLGYFYGHGVACEKDLAKSAHYYLIAAELGDVVAAEVLPSLQDESDPARWIWLSRTALKGASHAFLASFSNEITRFLSGSGNSAVAFLIGFVLKGNIDLNKKKIFGNGFDYDAWIRPANQAVSFYEHQIESARLAVETWTMISTRLHLIKDMRKLIAKMIWEGRFEANYKTRESL